MSTSLFRSLLVIATLAALSFGALAQSADGGTTTVLEAIKPALEQAGKSGATVIVVTPGEDKQAAGAAAEGVSIAQQLMQAKLRFDEVLDGHRQAWGHMRDTLARSSPDGRINWLFYAIIAGIAGVIGGRLLSRPIANWLRDLFAPRIRDVPETRSQKIGYLLFRGIMFVIIATIGAAIGTIVVVLYAGEHAPARTTGLAIVWTYALIQYASAIYINFLVPNVPAYRVINMNDAAAGSLYRALMAGTAISLTILGLCLWMSKLGLDENTHKLALMAGALSATVILSVIAVVHRQAVAQSILGFGDITDKPGWQRTLAKSWHIALIIYVSLAWLATVVRLLLDRPQPMGLVGAPLAALVIGLTIYAVTLIAIDAVFDRAPATDEQPAPHLEGSAAPIIEGEVEAAEDVEPDETAEPADTGHAAQPAPSTGRLIFKGLAEHGAALMVTIIGLFYIAGAWGIDLTDQQSWMAGLLDIAIVVFIAYIAYRAVEIWVDAKRQAEGDVDPEEAGGDPGGHGSSRLVTLLPILRNFLLITIVVIAGMITLSEMGVDIGPLFAGAGVVGLAIGFGAQTLVRDIFSGAFFLIDDAFRKGEYIDIGTAKGTVEKISIRSFQLRHHRGALNTVPFGEIRQLTNYSRDWVLMKLPIRLTYDTDPEKVRRLVKRLGMELLEDPDIGALFLQPLKSQGVYQMDDSAMIVRLKFMTRPGDQFGIRTKVYARVRELFEQEGIKFAHREVTVRVSPDSDIHDPEQVEAAAAAALASQSNKPAAS